MADVLEESAHLGDQIEPHLVGYENSFFTYYWESNLIPKDHIPLFFKKICEIMEFNRHHIIILMTIFCRFSDSI